MKKYTLVIALLCICNTISKAQDSTINSDNKTTTQVEKPILSINTLNSKLNDLNTLLVSYEGAIKINNEESINIYAQQLKDWHNSVVDLVYKLNASEQESFSDYVLYLQNKYISSLNHTHEH